MEFRRLRWESLRCLKLAQLEAFVEQNSNIKYNILLTSQGSIYEVYRVSTTTEIAIFHVGEQVGHIVQNSIQLNRQLNKNTSADRVLKDIYQNGKSVNISVGDQIHEVVEWSVGGDIIVLAVGDLVGEVGKSEWEIQRDIKRAKNKATSKDAWFNYN